jgi:hypothetical protein
MQSPDMQRAAYAAALAAVLLLGSACVMAQEPVKVSSLLRGVHL